MENHYSVGEARNEAEVMRNVQVRKRKAGLQTKKQVRNMKLDRPVKTSKRLIQDQQPGFDAKSSSDGEAPPLTGTEFMGQALAPFRPQSDLLNQIKSAVTAFLLCPTAIAEERLGDERNSSEPGIQRRSWILEDHLDLSPERNKFAVRERSEINTIEPDFSAVRFLQARETTRES
jgi:hypothetical protein